jgi:RNase H-like domain found in reverse transcriptase
LDSAQQRYLAFDRKLLAAFLAVKHFRYLLEGRRFILYTNH